MMHTRIVQGREIDGEGKCHIISRVICNGCGAILSETHYGCCGDLVAAEGSWDHECPVEKVEYKK